MAIAATLARAASIEVRVVDESGVPVAGARVYVIAPDQEGLPTLVANAEGIATAADLAVGTWHVGALPGEGAGLVAGGSTPVTVLAANEKLAMEVHVVRASEVRVAYEGPGAAPDTLFVVTFVSADGRATPTWSSGPEENVAYVAAGDWTVSTGDGCTTGNCTCEVDGATRAGGCPRLSVLANGDTHRIVIRRSVVGGRVRGVVTWEGDGPPPVDIFAERLDGDAGGPIGRATLREDGSYVLSLPPGRWTVFPAGFRDEIDSIPPSLPASIEDGTVLEGNFRVVLPPGRRSRPPFDVRVEGPDGEAVTSARFAVYRFVSGLPEGAPLWMASVGSPRAFAPWPALDSGDYFVAAWDRRWAANGVEVLRFDPEEPRRTVSVRLRPPATLGVSGPARRAASRVRLEADCERPAKAFPIPPGRERDDASHRVSSLDENGRAFLQGLEPGLWLVRAATPDAEGSAFRLGVRARGGELSPFLEVDLDEGEESDVEVIALPAASARVTVECRDGEAPGGGTLKVRAWKDGERSPVFDRGMRARPGNDVIAGPLDAGRYLLEVTPAGFARSTFWPGTEDRAKAEPVELPLAEEPVELGTLAIDCAPAVRIRAVSDEGTPVEDYDFTEVEASARIRESEDASWRPLEELRRDARPGELWLHGLPSGEPVDLEITIRLPDRDPHVVVKHGPWSAGATQTVDVR